MRKPRPVGQCILSNFSFLKNLARTRSSRKRYKFLKEATRDELLAIVEICVNILRENFPLTTKQKLRLVPYAHYIRKLSARRSETGARQLIQKGAGGPVLPALLLPIISEVGRALIAKNTATTTTTEHGK